MPPEGSASHHSADAAFIAVIDRLSARVDAATTELARIGGSLEARLSAMSEDHRDIRSWMATAQQQLQNFGERFARLDRESEDNAEARRSAREQEKRWFLIVGGVAALGGLLSVLTSVIVVAQFVLEHAK